MAARLFSVLALVLSSACAAFAQTGAPTPPEQLTVAEKSDFKATARYDEVVSLLDTFAKASPKARRLDMGKTGEVARSPCSRSPTRPWPVHARPGPRPTRASSSCS